MEQKVLLDVKNLRTSFFTDAGEVKSVNDVSFHVNEGEIGYAAVCHAVDSISSRKNSGR